MKKLTALIDQLARRHGFSQAFDDFLSASVCALSLGRMEKRYAEIMKRYDSAEEKLFSQMLVTLLEEASEKSSADGAWTDLLGDLFMENNSRFGASALGQFFTPVEVSDLMAMMLDKEPSEEYNRLVMDPAAGSGRCLISHSRLNPKNRFNHFYIAQELDRRCVNMCVLNFVMYGLRGAVIHMDTLRVNIYGGYRIWMPETGLLVQPLTADQCRAYVLERKNQNDSQANEPECSYQLPQYQLSQTA